jgi:hypothetical protein
LKRTAIKPCAKGIIADFILPAIKSSLAQGCTGQNHLLHQGDIL